MLLEFKVKNYKSFKDEMSFSLMPAPKQSELKYSILKEAIENKIYKGLCSAVIYGANASGKTNIIGAMDTFKSILLHGNIRNSDHILSPNAAANSLELIPNNTSKTPEPVSFSIQFTTDNMLIEYALSLDLGLFLDTNYPRKILSEILYINNELIFERYENSLRFGSFKIIHSYLTYAIHDNEDSAKLLSESSLQNQDLFLTNGFKAIFSYQLVTKITNWLENQFIVIYRADSIQVTRKFNDSTMPSLYIEKTINEAAKCFGINSNALGFTVDPDTSESKLASIFTNGKENISIPAEVFESYGTIRFINLFPLVARALFNGSTLIIDEFDASIHPMALMNIVNIFHNDEINKKHAQLIFNTHNPIFLNNNLFRRDEIKFVERDDDTHCSSQYSLSDFGTTGSSGVRKNADYMKNYFIDRYGAIKNVDFTPIFESILSSMKEV